MYIGIGHICFKGTKFMYLSISFYATTVANPMIADFRAFLIITLLISRHQVARKSGVGGDNS